MPPLMSEVQYSLFHYKKQACICVDPQNFVTASRIETVLCTFLHYFCQGSRKTSHNLVTAPAVLYSHSALIFRLLKINTLHQDGFQAKRNETQPLKVHQVLCTCDGCSTACHCAVALPLTDLALGSNPLPAPLFHILVHSSSSTGLIRQIYCAFFYLPAGTM